MRRVDEIKAMAGGTLLPKLSEMEGFADWLNSPITLELLARCEAKRDEYKVKLDAMMPCALCRRDAPDVDKEYRGMLAGYVQILGDGLMRTITADTKVKDCDCPPAA